MILSPGKRTLEKLILTCTFLFMTACPVVAADTAGNVCVQCHGTLPGRLGEPVAQWRGSIHAANGIFCNGCHGGDPNDSANAMSPARGFLGVPKENAIPAFCGRCHVGVLQSYQASAHATAQGKEKPHCVTCHSNHHVVKASLDLINEKSCGRCHSYDVARQIKEAMAGVETRIGMTEQRIATFKGKGTDTSRLEQRLFAGRNRFHSLAHVVDVNLITKNTAEINAELDAIDGALEDFSKLEGKKKIIGAAAIVIVLAAAALLAMYRRTYD